MCIVCMYMCMCICAYVCRNARCEGGRDKGQNAKKQRRGARDTLETSLESSQLQGKAVYTKAVI